MEFGKRVCFGVRTSPYFYSGYVYIDARKSTSKVVFGDNVKVNNNCSFISEGDGIFIGRSSLIGTSCEFIDSDFHALDPDQRKGGLANADRVTIGENVFIGSSVKVLKGVTIGKNSVIANGSIVTRSIPDNVVAGGVPAKVIRKL